MSFLSSCCLGQCLCFGLVVYFRRSIIKKPLKPNLQQIARKSKVKLSKNVSSQADDPFTAIGTFSQELDSLTVNANTVLHAGQLYINCTGEI